VWHAKNKNSRTKLPSLSSWSFGTLCSSLTERDLTRFSLVRDSAGPKHSEYTPRSHPRCSLPPIPLPPPHFPSGPVHRRCPNATRRRTLVLPHRHAHIRIYTRKGARARTFIIEAGAVIIIKRCCLNYAKG